MADPTTYVEIANSTFADYDSSFSTGLSTVPLPASIGRPGPHDKFNVALILDRNLATPQQQAAFDQLIGSDNWAQRQQTLEAAGSSLWSTYGANPDDYTAVTTNYLKGKFTFFGTGPGATEAPGYVSSAESRTVWVNLDADDFAALFGTDLHKGEANGQEFYFWRDSLSLPSEIQPLIKGLWFDTKKFAYPLTEPASPPQSVSLPPGNLGVGNGAGFSPPNDPQNPAKPVAIPPQDMAALFNFPLPAATVSKVDLGALALMEPKLGDQLDHGSFEAGVHKYLDQIGITGAKTKVFGIQPGGADGTASTERSLDIGVAAAINPGAKFLLYAGSGKENDAKSDPFTPYQSAFFDPDHDPLVISSSFRFENAQPSEDSPFMWAARQLFIDGLLRNITVFNSSGDGGSGYAIPNGLTNTGNSRNSPYTVVVGGTSLSTLEIAEQDTNTLTTTVGDALALDTATLWSLVQGGLTTLPDETSPESLKAWFIQTVWNRYYVYDDAGKVILDPGYLGNQSSNGGVDFTQPTPSYQAALLPFNPPTLADDSSVTGRGVPDVSAPSSGNMYYEVPNGDMPTTGQITHGDGGTSAATPFWASLILQINAILRDQGIPYNLGYINDLLYNAAIIAPASFNDVTMGDNNSSYLDGPHDSTVLTPAGKNDPPTFPITPTNLGYEAGLGYDLASGIGTPNGVMLARTLSAITNQQLNYENEFDLLAPNGTSAQLQTVLIQAIPLNTSMGIDSLSVNAIIGGVSNAFTTAASSMPWNARLAEQTLQSGFDSQLVTLFDGVSQATQAQGSVVQATLQAGQSLAITINGDAAITPSLEMTNPFGFADFQTVDGTVRVARVVAVAETMNKNAQDAVVYIRQNGQDDLSVIFYQVDDLAGSIGGVQPGSTNYANAAFNARYTLSNGSKILAGPGYGNYISTQFAVESGDLVAMAVINNTQNTTFWAFAQANETAHGLPVGHLWNYGLNTWGWEDTSGGGDGDYNDLIVGYDFTATAGQALLVGV